MTIDLLLLMTDPKFRIEPPPGQRCAGSAYNGGTRAGGGKRCCTPQVRICVDIVVCETVCILRNLVTRGRATVTAVRTGAVEMAITAAR